MSKNVVFLAFSSDKVEPEGWGCHTCKRCRNKTFLLVDNGAEDWPMLRCAACGDNIGKVGWASDNG